MGVARKLKYQQPSLMAVKNEHSDVENKTADNKKKWKVDKAVLLTWILAIAFSAIFWYLIIRLFR